MPTLQEFFFEVNAFLNVQQLTKKMDLIKLRIEKIYYG